MKKNTLSEILLVGLCLAGSLFTGSIFYLFIA
jgi:hypothetical protein